MLVSVLMNEDFIAFRVYGVFSSRLDATFSSPIPTPGLWVQADTEYDPTPV